MAKVTWEFRKYAWGYLVWAAVLIFIGFEIFLISQYKDLHDPSPSIKMKFTEPLLYEIRKMRAEHGSLQHQLNLADKRQGVIDSIVNTIQSDYREVTKDQNMLEAGMTNVIMGQEVIKRYSKGLIESYNYHIERWHGGGDDN